ncbi:hypothetical protein [Kordiimonas sp.]|uniref:hypothetical protein n=1 Tax=Kordiimonas sp. TaxID=1970157 RepID=UPI003A94E04E
MLFRSLSTLVLAGCVATVSTTQVDAKTEVRTYISQKCLLSPDPKEEDKVLGFLAGIFVPMALEWVIGGVAKSIREASKEKSHTLTDKDTFDLYVARTVKIPEPPRLAPILPNPKFGCLTTVVGEFEDAAVNDVFELHRVKKTSPVDFSADNSMEMVSQRLKDNKIKIKGTPKIVYEGRIAYSNDQTAFQLKSQYLQVDQLHSTTSKKARGMTLMYEIKGPAAEEDGSSYALIALGFGDVARGKKMTPADFASGKKPGAETGWVRAVGLPYHSRVAYLRAVKTGNLKMNGYAPARLITRLTEIEAANKTGLFIAEVLDGVKEDVAAEIAKKILPESRRAAEKEETAKIQGLEQAKRDAEIALAEAKALLIAAQTCADGVSAAVCDQNKAVAELKVANAQAKYDIAKANLESELGSGTIVGVLEPAPAAPAPDAAMPPGGGVEKESMAPEMMAASRTFKVVKEGDQLLIDNKSFFLTPAKWPQKTIFVCWENPEGGAEADRQLVKAAVDNSWQAHSGLSFKGWGQCTDGTRGIRIRIDDSSPHNGPHVKGLGKYMDGVKDGMVLNFTFRRWGSDYCAPSENRRQSCIYSIAVHEFGHAIGLAHEHNSWDTPGECQIAPQGTDGDVMLTEYDPDSVMNYCNERYNNDGELSPLDIAGIQFIYGAPY